MESVTGFLEKKLKLRVNREKSAVDVVWRRKFLGYRLGKGGKLHIAPESLRRFKDKIRSLTRRNQAVSFEDIIKRLNRYLPGWLAYFQYGMRLKPTAKIGRMDTAQTALLSFETMQKAHWHCAFSEKPWSSGVPSVDTGTFRQGLVVVVAGLAVRTGHESGMVQKDGTCVIEQ